MALRGGYQIIDLKNRAFDTEIGNVEKYSEIYYNILNSHAKFIVLSGLNMDGIKWGDREIIIYEQNNGDGVYFQAELRRIWNTSNKTCTTKYINIYPDDTVKLTVDSFIYEPDNDKALSSTSTNAVENKVIKKEFDKVYYLDGSRETTGTLNLGSGLVYAKTGILHFNAPNSKRVVLSNIEYPEDGFDALNAGFLFITGSVVMSSGAEYSIFYAFGDNKLYIKTDNKQLISGVDFTYRLPTEQFSKIFTVLPDIVKGIRIYDDNNNVLLTSDSYTNKSVTYQPTGGGVEQILTYNVEFVI